MRRRLGSSAIAMGLLLLATQPAAAIVYGQPDSGNSYRNVGVLVVQDGTDLSQVCSGTLINDTYFLTAAHCILALEAFGGFIPGDPYVSFDQDLDDSPTLIVVTAAAPHPRFNRRRSNPFDIGVLTLASDPGLTPATVAPVSYLGGFAKRALRQETFTAVGYGVTRDSRKQAFQGIDFSNLERNHAEQSVNSIQKAWLTLSMNQATGDGGACYGDSGGPHFHGSGSSMVIASITITGDAVCKATDKTYRLDRPWVHEFLAPYLP
jgi:secreted trypsin-like serine protease